MHNEVDQAFKVMKDYRTVSHHLTENEHDNDGSLGSEIKMNIIRSKKAKVTFANIIGAIETGDKENGEKSWGARNQLMMM